MTILKDIEAELCRGDRPHQAYAAFRTVLHALRDRLTVEQAAHLGAQLPMLVKGFYYDGWDPHAMPVKMKKEEFVDTVRSQLRLALDTNIERLIQTVLLILERHIDPGELEKIKKTLPKDLQRLIA